MVCNSTSRTFSIQVISIRQRTHISVTVKLYKSLDILCVALINIVGIYLHLHFVFYPCTCTQIEMVFHWNKGAAPFCVNTVHLPVIVMQHYKFVYLWKIIQKHQPGRSFWPPSLWVHSDGNSLGIQGLMYCQSFITSVLLLKKTKHHT